jgi:acyl-coenzyme A thioesterase PaaI-like protein
LTSLYLMIYNDVKKKLQPAVCVGRRRLKKGEPRMFIDNKEVLKERKPEQPATRFPGIRPVIVGEGYGVSEMRYREETDSIGAFAPRGAIYSLMDEALELSSRRSGTTVVVVSMSITRIRAVKGDCYLWAESREARGMGAAVIYRITVTDGEGPVALYEALVYREERVLPAAELGLPG